MHPNSIFHWQDREELRAFVTAQRFGMIFMQTAEGPAVAHVPMLWLDSGRIGFHLSRGNRLVPHIDGARVLIVVNGPHAYVSPDWYGLEDQVPTWNYVAAELEGEVCAMAPEGLPALIDALSQDNEERLAPKPVWKRDKMTPGLFDRMTGAIIGYEMRVTDWRGTRKLGQNKSAEARERAAASLSAVGDEAIAALMRGTLP